MKLWLISTIIVGMKMKAIYRRRIKVMFFLLISIFSIQAQDSLIVKSAFSPEEHIQRMHNGILLIKLNTQSKRIEARKNYGDSKSAERLMSEVQKEHSQIRAAFEKEFNFMESVFFYSDDVKDVIYERDWSKLLSKESSIEKDKPIYIAYLEKPDWYSSTDTYFFIIYSLEDKNIIRLERPLPFYRSTKSNKLFKRTDYIRSVSKLNESLNSYLEKIKEG